MIPREAFMYAALAGVGIAGFFWLRKARAFDTDLTELEVRLHRLADPIETTGHNARTLAGGFKVDIDRTTRGLRNFNPGNIRWIPEPTRRWKGMHHDDGGQYAVFESPAGSDKTLPADAWGVRAIRKQLDAYVRRGLITVRQIISTWAPANENPTEAYVNAVATALQQSPDSPVEWPADRVALVNAIIRHENGRNPYAPTDIASWVDLA